MKIILTSVLVSFGVSFIMMKWHIINATQLFEKHLRESDIWFQKQLTELSELVKRHKR
ncbi:Uncharacterised protein [Streptococcus suis]|uniref:Uncharacterized protein n=1 Tax=Streptococcus suis TaxID=1307 RepID=A0A0Z8IXK5_STRSU|nr:hypothetical protein [Streptococcus suis]NQG20443.1 hypothetical protein [Streptococcus suis]NQG46160.1 hypothetical protein [Streptococcus suis]NQH08000.1 hypothetical protein [Streptococcus suis]NQH16316.1 hypothetical protein [Streptococcus suis]NQK42181.1 hypothetical protein [Streptococcus suis]